MCALVKSSLKKKFNFVFMTTYIAILRGINVSGKNIIKMAELKTAFTHAGFQKTTTYIQSGNIIFEAAEQNVSVLASEISGLILAHFKLSVPVIVLTIDMLQSIIDQNPFVTQPGKDTGSLHITFLDGPAGDYTADKIEKKKQVEEGYVIGSNAVYLDIPKYGNSKLTNNLFETVLRVTATTRNWKTANEILSIASQL